MGFLLSLNTRKKIVALSCLFLLSTSRHLASDQWFCCPPLSNGGAQSVFKVHHYPFTLVILTQTGCILAKYILTSLQ